MKIEEQVWDVAVVGAGLSGLTAAYEMLKTEPTLKVCVLEAKNRVGGRTLTKAVDAGDGRQENFDFGGQWVSSSQPDIMEMLTELGLEVYPQYISGKKIMQVGPRNRIRTYTSDIPSLGSWWGLVELQLFIWKVEKLCEKVPIDDPYQWDSAWKYDAMTMDTFTRQNLRTRAAIDTIQAACRVVLGVDLDRVSVLFFLAYANSGGGISKLVLGTDHGAQEFRVKGGTQQISEILAQKIGLDNVYLEQAVTGIDDDHASSVVSIDTSSGKLVRCRNVVVSIPPQFVARIQFSPALPENRRVLMENLPMGHLIKFIVIYDQAYWRQDGFSGEVVSNGGYSLLEGCSSGPISILYDGTTCNQVPALVGFIAGKTAVEWHHKREDERREAILSSLVQYFGGWAAEYRSYNEKVWASEPYNGGCPASFGVPGIMFTFQSLREPHGRVHWCGTETSTHWAGYLSGAVQSGRRAACEIMTLRGHDMSSLQRLVARTAYPDGPSKLDIDKMWAVFITISSAIIVILMIYYL